MICTINHYIVKTTCWFSKKLDHILSRAVQLNVLTLTVVKIDFPAYHNKEKKSWQNAPRFTEP